MDDITDAIAEFATGFRLDALDASVIHTLVGHMVDAFGCAVAGLGEAPAGIARSLAAEAGAGASGASVIGLAGRGPAEHAAFANATLVRCLDFNDTFNSRTGGHPSDMMPGILAAAEIAGRPGGAVVQGVFVAYEVFGALADRVPLRDLGIDQGAFVSVACAAGIASCLGLERAAAANAVSLALTTSMPLRVARSGELTQWKGAATPHAVMNAVFVTGLAARGMQGPPRPFRGVDGFIDLLGVPFELDGLGRPVDGRWVVERTGIKFLPVEWCAQAPVALFLGLASRLDMDGIDAIKIAGYEFMVKEIGGGRGDAGEKWDPQTRETADHSLPYLIAVALADGEVTLDSFQPARVADPALRPLMQRIRVVEDPASSRLHPARQPVGVTIRLKDGQVLEETCEFAPGHPENPASPAAIEAKFRRLTADVLDDAAARRLLSLLGDLPVLADLDDLTAALRAVPV